jgi:hypothetical protein
MPQFDVHFKNKNLEKVFGNRKKNPCCSANPKYVKDLETTEDKQSKHRVKSVTNS